MLTMRSLLQQLVERGGSDLLLQAGARPMLRIDGSLRSTEQAPLRAAATRQLIESILEKDQLSKLELRRELDCALDVEGIGRFRVSVFQQRGALSAALRHIPHELKSFAQLGLDEELCAGLCSARNGLILVTGAPGSGRSTTLASMVDFINRTRDGTILTLESPLEFVQSSKSCLVYQREIGADSRGLRRALRAAFRQDSEVVLIGEMRDTETIEAAVTLAATGHLIFGSLHSGGAVQSVNRIIDFFPLHQRPGLRQGLGSTLRAILWQQVLPGRKGRGRVWCREFVIFDTRRRWLIRNNQVELIDSFTQRGWLGIQTMNESLDQAVQSGLVDIETALQHSNDQGALWQRLAGSTGPRRDSNPLGDPPRIEGC